MPVNPDYEQLQKLAASFEGFENVAYKDSGGVWTLGTGHTFNYDKNRKVQQGDVITKDQDAKWMAIKFASVVNEANRYVKPQLNPSQSAAIVDYIYNRGIGNFLKTQLDELINANPNNNKIADELMGTGLKDRAGNLLWGLGRRRYSQAWLYFKGEVKTNWSRWAKPTI